jgi:ribonuclease D
LNRPPRVVLRDDLLPEIARRSHTRPEDLHALRGVSHRDADAILAAVRRAEALPPSEWPAYAERDIDPPHVATLASLLNVVLAEWCARKQLAPNLVATSQDLKEIVRARQPGSQRAVDSSLTNGWRAKHVRPYLEAVLEGESVIRVTDPRSPTPITVYPADEPLPPTETTGEMTEEL